MKDWVFLKVSPMKAIMRFGKKGKLSPQFVGLYDVGKHIGQVAYELNLPSELVVVHPVFRVSMLKKCIRDPSLAVPLESIGSKITCHMRRFLWRYLIGRSEG